MGATTLKRVTKVAAGVFSLAVLLVTLTACAPHGAHKPYLVLENVNAINCSVEETSDAEAQEIAERLQNTAIAVDNANNRTEEEVLDLNPGLNSLDDLKAALQTKFEECGGDTEAHAEPGATPSISATPAEKSVEISPELRKLLDASSAPLISCFDIVQTTGGPTADNQYALLLKVLKEVKVGDANFKQWSDALSTPLAGATPEEMKQWINRAICEEPVIGVTLAHLFAHLTVGGVAVIDLQTTDWLRPYHVGVEELDRLVSGFAPVEIWKLQNPGEVVPDDLLIEQIEANTEYRSVASKLVFLLSRYELAASVQSISSTHHYALVAGGLRADGVPEITIDIKVDDRPALVFYLTEKTACKPVSVLGFNVGDKRPMLGGIPETCEPYLPPAPPEGCVSNCEAAPPSSSNCPPGNEIPECAPKPADPSQWIYSGDKQRGPPVTDSGTDPAPVTTEQTGGGGVADTSDTPPSGESGVSAPGAEDPAPERSDPPAQDPVIIPTPAPSGDPGGM